MTAEYFSYTLNFKRPSGTSRGILRQKQSFFIVIREENRWGIGECGVLWGLSPDPKEDYEDRLSHLCQNINLGLETLLNDLDPYPSIRMGLMTAFASFDSDDPMMLYSSDFTSGREGIDINGLIWMGDFSFMNAQIKARLSDGFRCLKLKIGAHDFDQEYQLIRQLRGQYNPDDLEIRVDANGAFDQKTALEKLKRLSELKLHSIEQPIMPGQWSSMAELVAQSPLDIALDEELIGLYSDEEKCIMIDEIKPDYLILKPSLIGGFDRAKQWIDWAENRDIGWWVTSALESNIGLNAIAQFTASESCSMPQGLGTGSLYLNNIPSPLVVEQAKLYYDLGQQWSFNFLNL